SASTDASLTKTVAGTPRLASSSIRIPPAVTTLTLRAASPLREPSAQALSGAREDSRAEHEREDEQGEPDLSPRHSADHRVNVYHLKPLPMLPVFVHPRAPGPLAPESALVTLPADLVPGGAAGVRLSATSRVALRAEGPFELLGDALEGSAALRGRMA